MRTAIFAAREVLSVSAISAAVAPVRFAKAVRRAAISPIIASSVRTAFGSDDQASAHESQAARTGAAAGAIAPENRYALVVRAGKRLRKAARSAGPASFRSAMSLPSL